MTTLLTTTNTVETRSTSSSNGATVSPQTDSSPESPILLTRKSTDPIVSAEHSHSLSPGWRTDTSAQTRSWFSRAWNSRLSRFLQGFLGLTAGRLAFQVMRGRQAQVATAEAVGLAANPGLAIAGLILGAISGACWKAGAWAVSGGKAPVRPLASETDAPAPAAIERRQQKYEKDRDDLIFQTMTDHGHCLETHDKQQGTAYFAIACLEVENATDQWWQSQIQAGASVSRADLEGAIDNIVTGLRINRLYDGLRSYNLSTVTVIQETALDLARSVMDSDSISENPARQIDLIAQLIEERAAANHMMLYSKNFVEHEKPGGTAQMIEHIADPEFFDQTYDRIVDVALHDGPDTEDATSAKAWDLMTGDVKQLVIRKWQSQPLNTPYKILTAAS